MCLMLDQFFWGHSSRVCDISCLFSCVVVDFDFINVSGYRCEFDYRSRGREFDPGLVPYFC